MGTYTTPSEPSGGKRSILVGAHRGAMCHAPENTMAAFEAAIRFGTWRCELDVRRCGDGTIVVMHDDTLDRTTDGHGPVAALDLAQLRRLRAGGSEPIPTLAEVLDQVRGRTRLLIEIKEAGMADEVAALILARDMAAECTVSSFIEDELIHIAARYPQIATACFLTSPKPFDAAAARARLGLGMVVMWPVAVTAASVAAAQAAGLHVRCGFSDTLPEAQAYELFVRLAATGVDEIACGRPDWIAKWVLARAME